jgi:hypothetical protein
MLYVTTHARPVTAKDISVIERCVRYVEEQVVEIKNTVSLPGGLVVNLS